MPTDQGNRKHPNAGHRSASGTKRKIEDSKQSFEIVDNGPGVDSGVEEQLPKSKKTRVGIVPAACHSGKVCNLKRKYSLTSLIDLEPEATHMDADSEMSELTETEETPKPKRVRGNTLRRTGRHGSYSEKRIELRADSHIHWQRPIST